MYVCGDHLVVIGVPLNNSSQCRHQSHGPLSNVQECEPAFCASWLHRVADEVTPPYHMMLLHIPTWLKRAQSVQLFGHRRRHVHVPLHHSICISTRVERLIMIDPSAIYVVMCRNPHPFPATSDGDPPYDRGWSGDFVMRRCSVDVCDRLVWTRESKYCHADGSVKPVCARRIAQLPRVAIRNIYSRTMVEQSIYWPLPSNVTIGADLLQIDSQLMFYFTVPANSSAHTIHVRSAIIAMLSENSAPANRLAVFQSFPRQIAHCISECLLGYDIL